MGPLVSEAADHARQDKYQISRNKKRRDQIGYVRNALRQNELTVESAEGKKPSQMIGYNHHNCYALDGVKSDVHIRVFVTRDAQRWIDASTSSYIYDVPVGPVAWMIEVARRNQRTIFCADGHTTIP